MLCCSEIAPFSRKAFAGAAGRRSFSPGARSRADRWRSPYRRRPSAWKPALDLEADQAQGQRPKGPPLGTVSCREKKGRSDGSQISMSREVKGDPQAFAGYSSRRPNAIIFFGTRSGMAAPRKSGGRSPPGLPSGFSANRSRDNRQLTSAMPGSHREGARALP